MAVFVALQGFVLICHVCHGYRKQNLYFALKKLVTVNITVSAHPAGSSRQKEKRSILYESSVSYWWSIGDSNS